MVAGTSGALREPYTTERFAAACRAHIEQHGALKAQCKYEPPPGIKWDDATRTQLIQWGGLFGSYNEGSIGPGHCSEDASSIQ